MKEQMLADEQKKVKELEKQKSDYVSELRKKDREITELCDRVRVLETERKYR